MGSGGHQMTSWVYHRHTLMLLCMILPWLITDFGRKNTVGEL